jgi:hypothetical protein
MLEYGSKSLILMKEQLQEMAIAEMHFFTAGR